MNGKCFSCKSPGFTYQVSCDTRVLVMKLISVTLQFSGLGLYTTIHIMLVYVIPWMKSLDCSELELQ